MTRMEKTLREGKAKAPEKLLLSYRTVFQSKGNQKMAQDVKPSAHGELEMLHPDNREWWEEIISGEYQHYYEQMYGNR